MTDFRALCAELVAWAEKTSAHYYSPPEVLVRARAALAHWGTPNSEQIRSSLGDAPTSARLAGDSSTGDALVT